MQVEEISILVEVKEKGQVVFTGTFDQFPVVFGRAEHCHICLRNSPAISRVHGVILADQGRLYVNDLNSKNGLCFTGGEPFLQADFGDQGQFSVKSEVEFSIRRTASAAVEEVSKTLPNLTVEAKPTFAPIPPEKLAADHQQARAEHLHEINRLLQIETPTNFKTLKPSQVSLQGVLAWGDDIIDVRQFRGSDMIWVGGEQSAPIYVPGYQGKLVVGKVASAMGQLKLSAKIRWSLNRGGVDFLPDQAAQKGLCTVAADSSQLTLSPGDRFTCEVAPNVLLHLRYVQKNRFFIRRDWIENREEFKKAFQISSVVHAVAAAVLMLSAPKVNAPEVEGVPIRFAKLLVDAPKMPLAPPPTPTPLPEPPKPIEPPKVVEAPKPEPPPKRVKVAEVHKPKPKLKAKPKAIARERVKPENPPQTKPEPPKPSAEDLAARQLANALAAMPAPPTVGGSKSLTIKNDASVAGLAGQPGLKTEGLSGVLRSKNGKLSGSGGVVGGLSGPKVGQVGYSTGPAGGVTGSRGVAGAVVGSPRLEDFSASANGLSLNEVMAVVNGNISAIHRCYERALLSDSNLVGRVEYEWSISAMGRVTQAKVKRSEISNGDSLNSCVLNVFRAMKFPAAKNKQPTTANIGFPFGKEG